MAHKFDLEHYKNIENFKEHLENEECIELSEENIEWLHRTLLNELGTLSKCFDSFEIKLVDAIALEIYVDKILIGALSQVDDEYIRPFHETIKVTALHDCSYGYLPKDAKLIKTTDEAVIVEFNTNSVTVRITEDMGKFNHISVNYRDLIKNFMYVDDDSYSYHFKGYTKETEETRSIVTEINIDKLNAF